MAKTKDETKNYINLLKIVCMLFVIAMHVISKAMPNYSADTFTYKFMLFIDILLKSAVPVFIMISGNLLLNKKYKILDIIYKVFKYYIFFLIFNSMYMVMNIFITPGLSLDGEAIRTILIDSLTLKGIFHMWYFQLILLTYISVPLFQWLIGKNNKIIDTITLVVLVFLFQILPWFVNVFYINHTHQLVFLTYFYLGYYLKKYEFKFENILLFVLFIISYYFTYTKSLTLDHDYYYFNFIFFNISFISIFVFYLFSKFEVFLKNDKMNKIFKYFAGMNFSIYIFHGLVIGLLEKLNIINVHSYNNLLLILVNTILVYLMTYVISVGLKKLFKEI